MSTRARVFLADDQTLLREALHKLLDCEPEFVVVGQTADARDAVRLTKDLQPDILLLEWSMADATGELVLRGLTSASVRTSVIVLTTEMDRAATLSALEGGARGVVLKHSGYTELIRAMRAVLSGRYWVGHDCLADLIAVIRRVDAAAPTSKPAGRFGLTKRESDIISAVLEACTNRAIAERYSISEKTVKHHLTRIFEKVGVSTRLELARFAQARRLFARRWDGGAIRDLSGSLRGTDSE